MDIMPKDISRWSITNGTITDQAINLNNNGVASVNIEQRDIVNLPSSATLQLVTSIFSDGYNPNIFVDIYIDTTFHQRINCVDNRGLVHVEIELPEGSYSTFKFEILTDSEVTISNISLVVPTLPLEELLSDIREELPRILSYENRHKFSIGQIENPIGVISLRLLESASVNGHLQINFMSLEDCTVFLRFYTDDVVELYAPSTYTIKQGWNSIGIPHAYLYKTAGIHTMYVTAQVSNGSIIFEPNDVLYTIDGGRLASRTIDVGFDVRDITMRRINPYGNPTYVFAAGIDNGNALIRGREYSQEYTLAWEPISDLGPAKDIRIESDGMWVQTDVGYRFATFEYPSATVLKLNGDLEFIDLNNIMPTSIIASNVTNHSMIRGYNNISFSDRDQGMLIAYVKESKAYYRNIITLDGMTIIRPELRLLDTVDNVIRVIAVRLNDYRLAIVVEAEDINYLMVTERNWAGIAIGAEKIVAKPSIKVDFIEIEKKKTIHDEKITAIPNFDIEFLYASSFNEFIHVSNIDDGEGDFGKFVVFKTRFSINDLNSLDFSIIDEKNISFTATNITSLGDNEYLLEFNNFNNAKGNVLLVFKGLYGKNEAGYLFDTFSKEFTPANLIPSEVPAPKVIDIYNEGDKYIVIEFDNEIIGGVVESIDAFTLISTYWKDTFEDIELTEELEISKIEQISETKILLGTVIKRANTIRVVYNSLLGAISGETYPLESFEHTFVPNIEKNINPAVREKLILTHDLVLDFKKVNYNQRFSTDSIITAVPNISIDLIPVGEINP